MVIKRIADAPVLAQQDLPRSQPQRGRLLRRHQAQRLAGDGAAEKFEQGRVHGQYVAAIVASGKLPGSGALQPVHETFEVLPGAVRAVEHVRHGFMRERRQLEDQGALEPV